MPNLIKRRAKFTIIVPISFCFNLPKTFTPLVNKNIRYVNACAKIETIIKIIRLINVLFIPPTYYSTSHFFASCTRVLKWKIGAMKMRKVFLLCESLLHLSSSHV